MNFLLNTKYWYNYDIILYKCHSKVTTYMYKSIIIALGAILSLGAVIALIFGGNDISKEEYANTTQEEKEAILSGVRVDKKIDYTKTSPTVTPSKSALGRGNPIRDTKKVISSRVARTNTSSYNIYIDDPDNISKEHSASFVTIYGSISGEKFQMNVPKETISSYNDTITISVINRTTGEKQSAPASFLSNVSTSPNSVKEVISIPDGDVNNIEHSQNNSILPSL